MPGAREIERAYLFNDFVQQCRFDAGLFNSLLFRASLNPSVSTGDILELAELGS
jgi:hypothetical protein